MPHFVQGFAPGNPDGMRRGFPVAVDLGIPDLDFIQGQALPIAGMRRKARTLCLGASPRAPGFIALGSREEVKNGQGEALGFSLFPGRPAGARVAPQREPILQRDLPRIRESLKKLHRTFHVLGKPDICVGY
jgi:hypothetical protein